MKTMRWILLVTLLLTMLFPTTGMAETDESLTRWAMDEPVTVTILKNQNPATVTYVDGESATNNIYYNNYRDMLGITMEFSPRYLRRYMNLSEDITQAVKRYIEDVKSLDFPNASEQY